MVSLLGWLTAVGTPLIDVFAHATSNMVDFFLSTVFHALHIEDNYLRIQDDTLTGVLSSVDVATKSNLVKTGEALLKKHVTRMNIETGVNEPCTNHETNEDDLKRFAKMVSQERHLPRPHSGIAAYLIGEIQLARYSCYCCIIPFVNA